MPWSFDWFRPGLNPDTDVPFFLSLPPNRRVKLGSLLGAFGPPFVPVNQDIPFQPGSVLKFIKVAETEVDLRMILIAFSEEELLQQLAEFAPLFNPLMGQGYLQITNPSGDVRRLLCTCISGLQMDPSTYFFTSVEVPLTFYANYPYWTQGAPPNSIEFSPYNDGENTLLPLFPIFINRDDDTVYETTITNNGDVNSYLTVIINGPGESPILTNLSFGPNPIEINQRGVLDLSANGGVSLGVGEYLKIDFFNKTIVKGILNQSNQISFVKANSNFWPLLSGQNSIRFQILNATNQTNVQYMWNDAYSTMY